MQLLFYSNERLGLKWKLPSFLALRSVVPETSWSVGPWVLDSISLLISCVYCMFLCPNCELLTLFILPLTNWVCQAYISYTVLLQPPQYRLHTTCAIVHLWQDNCRFELPQCLQAYNTFVTESNIWLVDDWKYRPFNLTAVGQNVIVFLVTKTILRDCAPVKTFKDVDLDKGFIA